MRKKFIICLIIVFIFVSIMIFILLSNSKFYLDEDFGITFESSEIDYDNDGVDDYTDIYNSAISYVKEKPKYKSKYYSDGYPTDNYGVCTDVIWNAINGAGYDLKVLVDKDIKENMAIYNIEKADPNIDFRRVVNLKIFFDRNAMILTNDPYDINKWQKGDIVVFKKHIAIISEKRNKDGVTYIVHNSGNGRYEENSLLRYEIVGHYRWKKT